MAKLKPCEFAVLVSTNDGSVYQVALTKKELEYVKNLVVQMLGDKIMCFETKLNMTIGEPVSRRAKEAKDAGH